LSWASFIVEGVHLTVNVLETKTVEIRDESPNNLIAAKDGVIEQVSVSGGVAAVRKGQPVLKGDMLVTGAIQYSEGTTNLVRCEGQVLAKTQKSLKCSTPFIITESNFSGRVDRRSVLTFFGLKLPLSLKPVTFEHSKEVSTNRAKRGGSYSPVSITTVSYKEIKKSKIKLSYNEAREFLKEKINAREKALMKDVKIISYNDSFNRKDGVLELVRNYKCIENIAISEKIKINNVN